MNRKFGKKTALPKCVAVHAGTGVLRREFTKENAKARWGGENVSTHNRIFGEYSAKSRSHTQKILWRYTLY